MFHPPPDVRCWQGGGFDLQPSRVLHHWFYVCPWRTNVSFHSRHTHSPMCSCPLTYYHHLHGSWMSRISVSNWALLESALGWHWIKVPTKSLIISFENRCKPPFKATQMFSMGSSPNGFSSKSKVYSVLLCFTLFITWINRDWFAERAINSCGQANFDALREPRFVTFSQMAPNSSCACDISKSVCS